MTIATGYNMNTGTVSAPIYVDIGTKFAPIESPNFTGTPKINSVNIATTADVTTAISNAALSSYVTTTSLASSLASYVTSTSLATSLALYASLASPSFTGTVNFTNAPTVGTKTVATIDQIPTVPTISGVYAPLESPSFTGIPTAPTASIATNSLQVATTAFVKNQGYISISGYNTLLSTFWIKLWNDAISPTISSLSIDQEIVKGWYRLEILTPPDPEGPHTIKWDVPDQVSNTWYTSMTTNTYYVTYFYIYPGTYWMDLIVYNSSNPGYKGSYFFTRVGDVT
jgi:hypothetical protein